MRHSFMVMHDELYMVKVRISPGWVRWVGEKIWHESQKTEKLPGGGLEITFQVAGLDASIVALYVPSYTATDHLQRSLAIDISWNEFVGPLLKSLSPEFVIVIGKGVGDVVGDRLKKIVGNKFSVTEQPQARLTSGEHMKNYQKYYQICREHCGCGNSGRPLFDSL